MDTTSENSGETEPKASTPHKLPPRRIFSLEFKRRVIEESLQPGASVSVIARRNDVNSNLVFTWRKLYRAGILGGGADQSFIHVGAVGDRGGLPTLVDGSAGLIELELPGGIRLRMDSRIEEAALARVLRAVKSCA